MTKDANALQSILQITELRNMPCNVGNAGALNELLRDIAGTAQGTLERQNQAAPTQTINNVTIGDIFTTGDHSKAVVVDFHEKRSLSTGNIVGHACIARGMGLASNSFEVPFATVCRNRQHAKGA